MKIENEFAEVFVVQNTCTMYSNVVHKEILTCETEYISSKSSQRTQVCIMELRHLNLAIARVVHKRKRYELLTT